MSRLGESGSRASSKEAQQPLSKVVACSGVTIDSPHRDRLRSGGAIFRQKSNRLVTPRSSGDTVGYAAETWRCLTLLCFIPSSKLRTTVTTLTSIQNLHKVELPATLAAGQR